METPELPTEVEKVKPVVVDPFNLCLDPDKEKNEQQAKEQALDFAIKDLEDRRKKLEKAEKKLDPMKDAVRAAKEYLEAVCYHPPDKVEEKSDYYDGNYNDRAYTDKWCECTICGAKSEKTHTTHSWYG